MQFQKAQKPSCNSPLQIQTWRLMQNPKIHLKNLPMKKENPLMAHSPWKTYPNSKKYHRLHCQTNACTDLPTPTHSTNRPLSGPPIFKPNFLLKNFYWFKNAWASWNHSWTILSPMCSRFIVPCRVQPSKWISRVRNFEKIVLKVRQKLFVSNIQRLHHSIKIELAFEIFRHVIIFASCFHFNDVHCLVQTSCLGL